MSRVRKLDPRTIRADDHVRIKVPRFVLRVGYPKTVDDYLSQVEEKAVLLAAALREYRADNVILRAEQRDQVRPSWFPARSWERIKREVAYGLACLDGFGGNEHGLFQFDISEYAERCCTVERVITRCTGRRVSPQSSNDPWNGDYDYDPGGLADEKRHRIALLKLYALPQPGLGPLRELRQLQILVTNLEKIGGDVPVMDLPP